MLHAKEGSGTDSLAGTEALTEGLQNVSKNALNVNLNTMGFIQCWLWEIANGF